MRFGASTLGLFLCAILAAGVARADDSSEARLHDQMGRELLQQGRYREALQQFLASNRLVRNPNVVFNVAEVYRHLGRSARGPQGEGDRREAYNWYETYLTEFEIGEEDRAVAERRRAELEPELAILVVTTEPPGATVYVDRQELGAVGRTPRRVAVVPGSHTLVLHRDSYGPAREEVTAAVGERTESRVVLERLVAELIVESEPAGATVHLAGRDEPLGTTPLRALLPVGSAEVVIRREGYVEQARVVDVVDGQPARLSVRLGRDAARMAVLSVMTNPSGATVIVDGEPRGAAPLTLDTLAPGSHEVEVTAEGHDPWSTEVLVEAGSSTRVRATLVDPDERPWTGWRWIGYGGGAGLVAAGAVVGGLALAARSDFLDAPNPTAGDHDRVETMNLVADVLLAAGVATLGVTLTFDLLSAAPPVSSGDIEVDR